MKDRKSVKEKYSDLSKNERNIYTDNAYSQSSNEEERLGLWILGGFMHVFGGIVFLGAGTAGLIWAEMIIFEHGWWALLLSIIFTPITAFFSVWWAWLSSGVFNYALFFVWLAMAIGLVMYCVGGYITGED